MEGAEKDHLVTEGIGGELATSSHRIALVVRL